jgi:hypothetical protein
MMDLEGNSNTDFIYQKLTTACDKSNTLLYKKAYALVKGIKENSKNTTFTGIKGLKTYTKCILDLLQSQSAKIFHLEEEELKNRETLIFLLAVCIKQLPFALLRQIAENVVHILDTYLQIKSFFVKKYSIIIYERLLLSRSEQELKDEDDFIVSAYIKFFFAIMLERSDDLHKCLIKSFSKIMKTPEFVNHTNLTIMLQLKKFLISKIRGLNLVDNVKLVGQDIKALTTTEGEIMLKFLCSVLQFLPFSIVNEIVLELNDLVSVSDNKHIILNTMLSLDVAFNTKKFALETVEKVMKSLLARDFLMLEEDDAENALTIAYVKAITQVLINMGKTNIISAMRYITSLISIVGEYFSTMNTFLKGTVYNCLYTVFNTLLSAKNIESLLNYFNNANNNMDLDFELSLTKSEKFDLNEVLEKMAICLLYFISDRFDDYRHAFNLLYTFLDKIHTFQALLPIVENIMHKLSENEKLLRNETFKVFIAKCFNLVSSQTIIKYFPLQILDFDITNDDYTETSKVWLISYIDKFLKPTNEIQTLHDFFDSFYNEIKDIDKIIKRMRSSMSDTMEVEEELDENFMLQNDTPYVKNLKIKRYELILQQIWTLTSKFANYCQDYDQYVKELFDYYSANSDVSIYYVLFKTVSKIIQTAGRQKDMKAIEVLKKEGKAFFTKSLNMVINQKLNSHIQEAFYLISNFCKIFSENFMTKIICDMIEKFENAVKLLPEDNESYNSNKAKLNEDLARSKKFNILPLRIEIINLVLLNIKIQDMATSKLFELLQTFFDNFYFNAKINKMNNSHMIKKKLIDLFLIMLEKMNDPDKILNTFNLFVHSKSGLDNTNSKQKARLFEFILKILIQKLKKNERIDAETVQSQFNILVEIVSLTKDMNRKVRNMAFEMIGETTDFMTESNLFGDWVRMIFALLTSNSQFLKSASINALARIFWAKRDDSSANKLLQETAEIVILLFKENSKEISKAVFLFLRVLLYQKIDNLGLISKILYSIFNESNENIRNEFKVKIRNLIKSLIIKFSFEEVQKIFPKEEENLLLYINKHIVKKIKTMNKEDELVYGNVKLDNTVMMDNEENLVDEEEEFIEKEFKKVEKRKLNEDRILGKLANLDLEEDDPEIIKKIIDKVEKKPDKIEELFKKDNVELENFFYVNPYVREQQAGKDAKKQAEVEKENDVIFDRRKGKIVVKDLYKDKPRKKKQVEPEEDMPTPLGGDNILGKKRMKVKNVAKDKNDFDDEEGDVMVKKRKLEGREEKLSHNKLSKNSHVVKFSGEEYRGKSAKGDKLIQGKYEPFAYIQLNPKTTSKRNRKEAVEMFKKVMKP